MPGGDSEEDGRSLCWAAALGCLLVFGPKLILDSKGVHINQNDSDQVWIGHLVSAKKIAEDSTQLAISLPLSKEILNTLFSTLRDLMQHNYCPSVLTLGATAMALHYLTLIQRNHHCHIPFQSGASGTGKTTALRSGLSLLGAHEKRFFSHGTKEKYTLRCSECAIPVGCDDPVSELHTGQMVVDLYNGAKFTTVKHGDLKPLSTAIVSANFTMTSKAR